ncbi:MAG: hypothetical protein R3C16_08935 [Hyphomonadaceae bacterium]
MAAAPDQPAAFDIALPALTLDVPGTFAEPISFSNVQAVGSIVSADRTIPHPLPRRDRRGRALSAEGRVYWAEAGADRRLRPGIALTGALDGALEARTIVALYGLIGLGEEAPARSGPHVGSRTRERCARAA